MSMPQNRGVWLLFVAPCALYLACFLLLPFVNVLVLSFYTHSPTRLWTTVLTTDNYTRMGDFYYFNLFFRTMRVGLVTTLVCAVIGFPLAYFLARSSERIATLGLFLLIMPLMVSAVIRTFGWLVILGRRGVVNNVIQSLGFDPVPLLYTETAVVVGLVNIYLPFMVLPIMASIERIEPAIEEASRNLGATWMQALLRTVLPLSVPGLVSGGLLVYAASISAFVTPALMGGARVRMVGQQIYEEVLVSYYWSGASAVAMVLVGITLLLLFVAVRSTSRLSRLDRTS